MNNSLQIINKRWLRLSYLGMVALYLVTQLANLAFATGTEPMKPKAIAKAGLADITCNTPTPWINGSNFSGLSADITDNVGSILPLCLGSVSDIGNLVDGNLTNSAGISITGVGCNATLSVSDPTNEYPAGTYAGYEVSTANLISGSIASEITITTWNNGNLKETYNAVSSLIGINASLINGNGNAVLGFVTTQPFDEVRITYDALVSALFSAQVYGVVLERFCAAPALGCNVQTQANNPTFPTIIDPTNTGITGVACVGCSVNNADNVLTNSTTDFASIVLAASVGSVGSIGVKDVLTTYPIGTFAGFNIRNPNLIAANLLSGITIKTYLNGTLQETSGTGTLLSVNSALLNGSGTQLVGFVSTKTFNEVKLEVTNLIGLLNTTEVYNVVFQKFCAGPAITCTANSSLVTPAFPAIIDGSLTGIGGVACVGCSVNNTNNVVDADLTNFADIVLLAGVGIEASIAVKDVVTTYPIGTFAGFDIENSALIGASLLNGASVRTYLDGTLQESSGVSLISLQLLSASRQIIGFKTTKPFNEVRLTVSNIAGVSLGSTKVYSAVLREASAAGGTAPVLSAAATAGDISNACPSATVDLTAAVTTPVPAGASLKFFTTNTPTGTAYATPTAAVAGTYYAFFYDATKDCYSPASAAITVTTTVCGSLLTVTLPAVQTAVTAEIKTGNALTELNPVGGVLPLNFTVATGDPNCVAPAGATALPAASNLVVNGLTGIYTYTAPSTPGTFYFCIKVCDSSTPTSNCVVVTYTLIVTGPACAVGSAVPGIK